MQAFPNVSDAGRGVNWGVKYENSGRNLRHLHITYDGGSGARLFHPAAGCSSRPMNKMLPVLLSRSTKKNG